MLLFLHALIDGPTALLLLVFMLGSGVVALRGAFLFFGRPQTRRFIKHAVYAQLFVFVVILILALATGDGTDLFGPREAIPLYLSFPFGLFACLPLYFVMSPVEFPIGILPVLIAAVTNFFGQFAVAHWLFKTKNDEKYS